MNFFRTQIGAAIVSLLLVVAVITPTVIKLSHALYEHETLDCKIVGEVHVHKVEIDCDFQKFKLTTQFYPTLDDLPQIVTPVIKEKNLDFYSFLSKHQKLHVALRGPPAV